MKNEKKGIGIFIAAILVTSMAFAAIPSAVAQEPTLILDLSIPDVARVADYDDGIYVVGTSAGDLYVINDAGEYTRTHLDDYQINDVRIENGYIAVAIGNMVKELLLPAGSLTPQLLWTTTIGPTGDYTTSVDLSEDGNYVAYLSRSPNEVGVIDGSNGNIISNYTLQGDPWATYWLDATGDMEYIAITDEPCPPGPNGTQSGVELYRFNGTSLERVWGTALISRYETTEVRISENKDYVAAATSSGTEMCLLNLTNGTVLWRYDTAPAEQFAVDGDDNLTYVIGGARTSPYGWFVLKNLGNTYQLVANGTMNECLYPSSAIDSSPDASCLAFGSDAGEFILLKRTDDTIETIFTRSDLNRNIDAVEVGDCCMPLVGGDQFIHLYQICAPPPAPVPTLTPIGITALIGLLSIIAAMSIGISIKKRRR